MRAASGLGRRDLGVLIAAVVAVVVFWVAYDDGSYGLPSRATLAIAVWWAVLVGLAFGLLAPRSLPRAALIVGGLVVALALWTLASVSWAPSVEDAFNEFNRVALYLGVYVFVLLAATRATVGRWADGLAVAIAAVAFVALASRLLPGSFPDRELATFLPSAATRLSFPLGYWNGLAILVALGVPLLLRVALVARRDATRGLALVPIPAIASVIYLASSRGGVVTAFVGVLAFVLLTERRWSVAAAVVVSGVGSWFAIRALLDRDELVNGPLGTELVRDQGRSAAALIGLSCLGTGLAFALGCRLLGPRLHLGRVIGRIATVLVVLALVAGVVASHPVRRFETFKLPPGEGESINRGDFVTSHLLSGSGSGRWQFWSSAIDEMREYPVFGDGAGAYERWWAEHGLTLQFVRDAHSLYLESLGELGVWGAALVVAMALAGILVGAHRSLGNRDHARVTTAALTAVFTGYAAAAGFDWVWELTAVSVVGFTALGLVSGAASEAYEPLRSTRPGELPRWTSRRRYGFGIVAAVIAWVLICAQAIPLLADREVARSQAAVERRDLDEASAAAESARDIQPWAATPYLQLALVGEQRGELSRARRWISEALERDERDWRLWLVSARLETKLGHVAAAERSLRRAAELNPRSPLFEGLLDQ